MNHPFAPNPPLADPALSPDQGGVADPAPSPLTPRALPHHAVSKPLLKGMTVRLTSGHHEGDLPGKVIEYMQALDLEDLVLVHGGLPHSPTPSLCWLTTLIRAEEAGNGQYTLWMSVVERGTCYALNSGEGTPLVQWLPQPLLDETLGATAEAELKAEYQRFKAEAQAHLSPVEKVSELASMSSPPEAVLKAMAQALTLEQQWTLLRDHLVNQEVSARTNEALKARTRKEAERAQKEAHLKMQLRAVQEELKNLNGAEPDLEDEEELSARAASLPLSEEAARHVQKNLKRMKGLQSSSSEHGVLQAQTEALLNLPWGLSSEGASRPPDLHRARLALEEAHHGLSDVKTRLLQYLAVRKLNPSAPAPILCLVGPPGVGKTSLAAVLARALNRPMVRISLGGVGDESEIRGHRRTYVGSMPGRMIKAVTDAKVRDPLILLDEIDKLGRNAHRGDPAAALLEVLDPEQNPTWRDHYLEVPWDLSPAVFVCTANDVSQIPAPLLDRMELIELSSYTPAEKVAILREHLWPAVCREHGLTIENFTWDEAQRPALEEALTTRYTREAGVRQLRIKAAALVRHVALKMAEEDQATLSASQVTVNWDLLEAALGPCPPLGADKRCAGRAPAVGSTLGLAWTPHGGTVLWIEALDKVAGQKGMTLSGKLGDVMKESAQAALSLAQHHIQRQGEGYCPPYDDIHVHLPGGAIPKDGPSAGVGLYWALRSLMTDKPLRQDVAMTGEITLQGRVLPVGGIKEKVLAAVSAGAAKVLLPEENRKDWLHEVPPEVRDRIEAVFLTDVREAEEHLLAPDQD